jgi:hypothetical protein
MGVLSRPIGLVANARLPLSPAERWLWVIACSMWGVGFVGLGVLVFRYTKGSVTSVPASAPLIVQVLERVVPAAIWGAFAMQGAWLVVRTVHERRVRREPAGNS